MRRGSMLGKYGKALGGVIVLVLILAASPAWGEPVDLGPVSLNVEPHRIVLNASGHAESIQAILGIVVGGVVPTEPGTFDFGFFVEEIDAEEPLYSAYGIYYCYVDDNLIVYFDRADLQEVLGDLGQWDGLQTVTVRVEGWFTVVTSGGGETEVSEVSVYGGDQVEVLSPGASQTGSQAR